MARVREAEERPSREARETKRFAALAAGFGAAVKATRDALHMTRERAAALSSLDVRHLQRIEAGEMNVTLATILRLADALDVPVPMLFVAIEVLREHLVRNESKALAGSSKIKRNPTSSNIQYVAEGSKPATLPMPEVWSAPDDVLRDLGRQIGDARRQRGLSQAQLAKRASMTAQHLQRIESGQQNVTVRSLARLCLALDLHPAALFAPQSDG